jgi:hypothetical protein
MAKLFESQTSPRGMAFECPGCGGLHQIPVDGPKRWDWNRSMDKPTFHPSIKVTNGQGWCCHSWVKDGRIEFCADSTHELAGKTVELPEIGS